MPMLCARALRQRRHALGLTHKELAYYLGLQKADIERLEARDEEISAPLFSRLCGALACDAQLLAAREADALTASDMQAILAFSRLTPEKRRAVAQIILQLTRPF